jgi:hypothetical protein
LQKAFDKPFQPHYSVDIELQGVKKMTKEEAIELIKLADAVASAKEQAGISSVTSHYDFSLNKWYEVAKQRRDKFVQAVMTQIKE